MWLICHYGYHLSHLFIFGRFLALYKGLLPKIMRLGPGELPGVSSGNCVECCFAGGGIMLVVFEQVSAFLKSKGL